MKGLAWILTDHIVKATASGVRAFAIVATDLVEEARIRHNCSPIAVAALGRTMTAALLLAANLKSEEEALTIKIAGDGPLGEIVADADAGGKIRGYVNNPYVDLPLNNGKLAVGQAVGCGHIYVTRFTGLKQPFTGSTELVNGEIAEDVTSYLLKSEQTPSSMALGVLIEPDCTASAAGGLMIQALPEAAEDILARIEQNLATLPPISSMIKQGLDAAGVIDKAFARIPAMFYEPQAVSFKCCCSQERVAGMLSSLGVKEIASMIADKHGEVVCHFCNEKYQFSSDELQTILDNIK